MRASVCMHDYLLMCVRVYVHVCVCVCVCMFVTITSPLQTNVNLLSASTHGCGLSGTSGARTITRAWYNPTCWHCWIFPDRLIVRDVCARCHNYVTMWNKQRRLLPFIHILHMVNLAEIESLYLSRWMLGRKDGAYPKKGGENFSVIIVLQCHVRCLKPSTR